jgi:hypothetical protein
MVAITFSTCTVAGTVSITLSTAPQPPTAGAAAAGAIAAGATGEADAAGTTSHSGAIRSRPAEPAITGVATVAAEATAGKECVAVRAGSAVTGITTGTTIARDTGRGVTTGTAGTAVAAVGTKSFPG